MHPRLTLAALLLAATPVSAQDLFDGKLLDFPGHVQRTELLDVTGDGHLDLVLGLDGTSWPAAALPDMLAVRAGDGRGEFGPVVVTTLPSPPFSLFDGAAPAFGDLDGDGLPDALVVSDADESPWQDVQTLLASGAGSFTSRMVLTDSLLFADSAALVDVDADGQLDGLASVNQGLAVLLGQGDGTLAAPLLTPLGNKGPALAAGDVDGDGFLDAVVTLDAGVAIVRWLRGDGAGGFAAPGPPIAVLFDHPEVMELADLDGDGALDLVHDVEFFSLGEGDPPLLLSVHLGHGDGSFGTTVPLPAPYGIQSLLVADLNESGLPDLVSAHGGALWIQHDPLGPVTESLGVPGWSIPYPPGFLASTVALGEIDGAEGWDAVCVGPLSDSESLAVRLSGDGAGDFATPAFTPLPGAAHPRLHDADGDGDLDAFLGLDAGGLRLARGDGAGAFDAPELLVATPPVTDLDLADLDADGDLDAVTAQQETHDLSLLLGGAVYTSAQLGGWPWFSWNQSPEHVRLADLDADGAVDIVVAKRMKASLSVIRALGDGQFALPVGFGPSNTDLPDLELGDLDEDGLLDLVTDTIWLNDGAGLHFLPGEPVLEAGAFGELVGGIELADLDGDGHLDVIVGAREVDGQEPELGAIVVRAGDGQGGLLASQAWGSEALAALATADFDGDGLRDLLTDRGGYTAVFGDGEGAFTGMQTWSLGVNPVSLAGRAALGDVNGDARPDLVLADGLHGALSAALHLDTPFAWSDLGGMLAGTHGAPRLEGHGPLLPGTALGVHLDGLPPDVPFLLVWGGSLAAQPLLGGTLIPAPDRVLAGLPSGPEGFLALEGTWPPRLGPGFELLLQAWAPDPTAPHGYVASNGLRAQAP